MQSRSSYKRLLSYVKPYTVYLVVGILATLLISGVDSLFAWLIKPMINEVFVARTNYWVRYIPLITFALFVCRGLAGFFSSYFINRCSRFVIMDLRAEIFDRLIALPLGFFSRSKTGELVSLVVYNVEQISEATSQTIVNAIQDAALVIGLLTMMVLVSWQMSLFILVICPLVYFLLRYVSKRTRLLSHRVQSSVANLISVTQECLRGLVLLRIHGTAEQERKRFVDIARDNRQQSLKVIVTNSISSSMVQLFLAIPVSLILLIASQSWLSISAGSFASLITAMIMIIKPVRRLSTTNSAIQKGIAGAETIFTLLDRETEPDTGTKELSLNPGHWQIRNLSFCYDGMTEPVLRDVNFSVDAGKTIAFVGVSGGGKSTLVKLLSGLYTQYSGEILLDDVNVREYKLSSLRSNISYVGQEPVIFSTTVIDNVVYGADQVDEERVWECLRSAELAAWVKEQPEQLRAPVGELGSALSGGQRQRLSIARALYRNAPITILDEATSALDYETERNIQLAIEKLDRHTLFIVAHRLSTIESADCIMVMREGQLVEQGTHDELLQQGGYYRKLYNLQSKTSGYRES